MLTNQNSLRTARTCFLVYRATFLIQAGGCFLIYPATFLIRKICVQSKQEAAF